ncbi:MAG: Fic family protein [Planctomycetota bacterium]
MPNRYSTKGLTEAEFEPGSNKRVLKNIPGLKSKRAIDQMEAQALFNAEKWAFHYFTRTHRFTESDIRKIHKVFLGKIYGWAGRYRDVNITKDNFPFAPARQIPRLMADLAGNILARYTPCIFKDKEKVVEAIGVVHSELLLIHPFREGNGRLARLLADLMALQAGLPALDYGFIKGRIKQAYYRAIQSGLSQDYEPIKAIVGACLSGSELLPPILGSKSGAKAPSNCRSIGNALQRALRRGSE